MEFSIRHYALSAAPYGINCNVIVPGVTKSDAWDKVAQQQGLSSKEEMFAKNKGMIPVGEVAEAKDIGNVVAFLSGYGGGRFITGLSLRVDGGLHLVGFGGSRPATQK
jgi:NAD(P)-dependent dehydrogenase (short-subunit alcohol dehydrogenase family)